MVFIPLSFLMPVMLTLGLMLHLNLLTNCIFAGLIAGLVDGIAIGIVDGIVIGVLAMMVWGIPTALWFGGLDVIQHYTLRFILWRTGQLPFRLVPFLDYCVERIFLRRVGGGYIFIHRHLMEYFASLTQEDIERLTQDEARGNQPA